MPDKWDSADGQTRDESELCATDKGSKDKMRIWVVLCPFKKNGFPSVGSFGSTVRPVVVIPVGTWNRLIRTIPDLANTKFEVGEEV